MVDALLTKPHPHQKCQAGKKIVIQVSLWLISICCLFLFLGLIAISIIEFNGIVLQELEEGVAVVAEVEAAVEAVVAMVEETEIVFREDGIKVVMIVVKVVMAEMTEIKAGIEGGLTGTVVKADGIKVGMTETGFKVDMTETEVKVGGIKVKGKEVVEAATKARNTMIKETIMEADKEGVVEEGKTTTTGDGYNWEYKYFLK